MTTMATRMILERAADLGQFRELQAKGKPTFFPQQLSHVYLKLDFKPQYENATTAEDARGFLRSVARAAMAAALIAERYDGFLLEVQGSTIHVGLPLAKEAQSFAGDLHTALQIVFNDRQSRVNWWCMTVDAGKTLIVPGRGVHGDESLVSLGRSANEPAKHLYAQLELPPEKRALKPFHVGIHDPKADRWRCVNLETLPAYLTEAKSIAAEARRIEPTLRYFEAIGAQRMVTAQAMPIGSPSPDKPHTYFGWVMRTDLDGFSARVEECYDNNEKLVQLAQEFMGLMDAAAAFVELHEEMLVQLPWAGDNFTAAAVFAAKSDYDSAAPKRLVELSLDFEKEMKADARACGFGGWAHGVAGGLVQWNTAGNVYLAGIELSGRRFLVGAGEGVGRSTQAFGDINPKAGEIVLYVEDWKRLDQRYKDAFKPAMTRRQEESSLYRKSTADALRGARSRQASVAVTTPVTFPRETRQVSSRPYFK